VGAQAVPPVSMPPPAGASLTLPPDPLGLPGIDSPSDPLSLDTSTWTGVPDFFIQSFRVPPFLLPIYQAAGARYDVPWEILAAINEVETDYGRNLDVSSAGAEGWMQFLPATWAQYGVDATGSGLRDPYNAADAIFAAARYLQAAGAAHDLRGAIFSYNHSDAYVQSVLLRARLLGGTPHALLDSLTGLLQGRAPLAASAHPHYLSEQVKARSASVPVVAGVSIQGTPGAEVLAAQDGTVSIGTRGRLGLHVILRDAWGDRYVYGHLGSLASSYTLAPRSRPGSTRGSLAARSRSAPRPLVSGAWVRAGTVLGRVAARSDGVQTGARVATTDTSARGPADVLFELRPYGGGRVDPRPLLDSWTLLAQTEGHPRAGRHASFARAGGTVSAKQLTAMSKAELQRRVLADPRVAISTCGRADVDVGVVNRLTLAALELHAGLASGPTAFRPVCHAASSARTSYGVQPQQWRTLMDRLAELPEPRVPSAATAAAVPDAPGDQGGAADVAALTPRQRSLLSSAASAFSTVQAAPSLAYQPVLGLPAADVKLLGAAPGEAPGEVWAQGRLGSVPAVIGGRPVNGTTVLLRRAAGSGWQIVPLVAADGSPLDFTPQTAPPAGAPPASKLTASGGVVLAGVGAGNVQTLAVRDPGGAFVEAPAPSASGPGAVLATGEQLFPPAGAPLLSAVDDSAHTGALIVPVGGSVPVVLHFNGIAWTREQLCDQYTAGACGTLNGQPRVLAIAASSAQNAWLLASSGAGSLRLYRRTTSSTGPPEWVLQQPQSGVFGVAANPLGPGVSASALTGGPMLTVTSTGVWVDAAISNGQQQGDASVLISAAAPNTVPAVPNAVTGTWCYPQALCPGASALGAALPSAAYESFAWPGAGGSDPGTRIVTGLADGALLRLDGAGDFSYVIAGGGRTPSSAAFGSPWEGWIGGSSGVGSDGAQMIHVTSTPTADELRAWPVPFRRPLLAIAGQPGVSPGDPNAQALAVGDQGQIARYVPGHGWNPEFLYTSSGAVATPRLRGVAWPEPGRAYAVGDNGAMWLYRSETGLWESDPATPYNFHGNLEAVAFSPTNPDVGYAVGKQGVLLSYDKTWTAQAPPPGLEQASFTSIAFAGGQALVSYRVPDAAGDGGEVGGLIVNDGSGWHVDPTAQTLLGGLTDPHASVLSKVAALPDGGAVAAGPGIVIERDSPGAPWRFSDQPLPEASNIAALAAVRDGPNVRALVSIDPDGTSNPSSAIFQQLDNPPAPALGQPAALIPPDPLPVSGYLLRESAFGWQDVENQALAQPLPSDGNEDLPSWPDAVLALLVDPAGDQGWAVGGQTGGIVNLSAPGAQLASQSAAALRLGAGPAPPQGSGAPIATAPGQATFAIGGNAQCSNPCADFANEGVGPDAWLSAAIARAGQIPGLHAFLYSGARVAAGAGQTLAPDAFARELQAYAGDLRGGALPVYAAASESDLDPSGSVGAFSSILAGAAPAGSAPTGTVPPPAGSAAYSFDSSGSGGTVRVIVLDYSRPTLAAGELGWLSAQLDEAAPRPAIVLGNRDLGDPGAANYAADAAAVGQVLMAHHASAYFYDSPGANRTQTIGNGAAAVPAFGTGTLGYVLPPPNPTDFLGASGFLLANVDVAHRNASTNRAPVSVTLTPNISQLALNATNGVQLRRSQVALFNALARRPAGGLQIEGFGGSGAVTAPDPYVPIPEICSGPDCSQFIAPAYTFSSSNPDIGNFVKRDPNNPNPRAVLQGSGGKPIPDPSSGLFCAFNSGTTTVSVQTGGLSYSEQVTILGGSVQQPCGTVPLRNPPASNVSVGAAVAPPPAGAAPAGSAPVAVTPSLPVAPALVAKAPAPPAPKPAAPLSFFTAAPAPATLQAALLPPPPVLARPIPPSGSAPVSVFSPAVAPEEQREEEEAVESVHNAVVYHPDEHTLPPLVPLALLVLAAGAGASVRRVGRSRRARPLPARAQVSSHTWRPPQ
jgi:Transglycosylase SLT domain